MKPTTTLFLFLTFFSSHTLAWTIKADFEYTPNAKDPVADSPNLDAFHGTAGDSRYVETPALSGNKSGSVSITKGDDGWGTWGGGFVFPKPLREGEEIWFRVNVYYPTDWSFSCGGCNQGMKFMRIATRSAAGKGEGYHSTLIRDNGSGGLISVDSELQIGFFNNNKAGGVFNKGTPVIRNQWHTYEMHIKFSSIPNQGIYRVWQDGNLIFEDLVTPTLKSSTSEAFRIYLYTYWNNGAPRTQTSYVDDIVITSEVPAKKDANGNPYVGIGPSIYVAPPGFPPGGGASGK